MRWPTKWTAPYLGWTDFRWLGADRMRVQALTEEERDILKALRTGEAVREIPMPMRGRLSLYNLVTETRQGWIITDEGREALMKAAKMRNRFADGSGGGAGG